VLVIAGPRYSFSHPPERWNVAAESSKSSNRWAGHVARVVVEPTEPAGVTLLDRTLRSALPSSPSLLPVPLFFFGGPKLRPASSRPARGGPPVESTTAPGGPQSLPGWPCPAEPAAARSAGGSRGGPLLPRSSLRSPTATVPERLLVNLESLLRRRRGRETHEREAARRPVSRSTGITT